MQVNLDEQLIQSSSRFARSGLEALPVGDHATFALHASIALEHSMKALLAKRHPAFIAAPDFDSLLHATGHAADARTPRHLMKTIAVRDCLTRVGRLVPALQNLEPQLLRLFDSRNAIAHLGETTITWTFRIPFLKAAEYLREELGVSREEYWGDFVATVMSALEERVEEAKLTAENALARARADFTRRYGHLDEEARGAVLHAIEAGYDPTKYEEDLVACPACGTDALVSGAAEVHWEQDDETSASFIATFVPGGLRCRSCDLELDGEDELRAAGVEGSWDINDADPADFYEPDWDM